MLTTPHGGMFIAFVREMWCVCMCVGRRVRFYLFPPSLPPPTLLPPSLTTLAIPQHILRRVEGQGLATITDVVYSTSVAEGSMSDLTGDRQAEYKAIMEEVREKEREMRALCRTEEVLKDERKLLTKYSNRIFRTTLAAVRSICTCTSATLVLITKLGSPPLNY